MRDLLFLGAGGFAREAVDTARAANEAQPAFDLLGFLDDDTSLWGTTVQGLPVLGATSQVADYPDAALVACPGSPSNYFSRKQLVERLGLPADRYVTVIHPATALSSSTEIGAGTVILAGVVTTASVRIGNHVAIMPGVVLTHDATVSNFVTFGAGAKLAGRVTVEEGAYIGAGSLVREDCRIGAWSLIGMGSVVLGDVPSRQVWVGSPAYFLRDVDESGVMSG